MAKDNKKLQPAAENADSEAQIALDLCEQLSPFCDGLGVPRVTLPDDADNAWDLYSPRVRAWLTLRFYERQEGPSRFLSDRDLGFALRILEGRAWRVRRQQPQEELAWATVENDVVAKAIVCFLNTHGPFSDLTRKLLRDIREDPVVKERLGAQLRHLPANTQVFSRRLKQLIPLFVDIGVTVVLEHTVDGSRCTLKLDSARFTREPDEPSVNPSGDESNAKASNQNNLEPADGTDGRFTPASISEDKRQEAIESIRHIEGQDND